MSKDLQSQRAFSPCLVLMTVSSEDEAKAIATQLVNERLIACANFFPIQSIYRWNNEICHEPEWQLVLKTDMSHFGTLKNRAIALHSYDVPEIIILPIADGYAPYIAWMKQETRPCSP